MEKSTRTERSRRFNVEANLVPLLRSLRPDDRTALLVELPSERDMARGLRRWLLKAGVDRQELHATTASTKAVTWHDLRATGWMAVRGAEPLKIMQRADHERYETTQTYVREAAVIRLGFALRGSIEVNLAPPRLPAPPSGSRHKRRRGRGCHHLDLFSAIPAGIPLR